MRSAPNPRVLLLAWGTLSLLLCSLAGWQVQRSLSLDLTRQLNQQLPDKLALALQTRLSDEPLRQWLVNRLEQDLQTLNAEGGLPLVHSCSARVTQLMEDGHAPMAGAAARSINIAWNIGSEPRATSLMLECHYNWPVLLLSQSLLALLLVIIASRLPYPLSKPQRARIARLIAMGLPASRARRLASQLCDAQIAWFVRALSLNGGDCDAALVAASAQQQLVLDTASQQVQIHGVAIKLAKTPFFYYLWYARLRQQGEGWLLNPPVNRPDRAGAESLIALMETHGGHAKSINDLREHGLRAKNLDQNRNKIRDELVSALGEELASAYLFESERDLKSGRYRYRLSLSAGQINVL
ncbi:hypothetical protein GNX18_10335 [Microbulbifer sp. SH-1]|nr:hypothetical protein GNX18_10335 [Microbulbifer sp. SH-1]